MPVPFRQHSLIIPADQTAVRNRLISFFPDQLETILWMDLLFKKKFKKKQSCSVNFFSSYKKHMINKHLKKTRQF